ncbi:hypothetical protein IH992_19405 [Candidatus Poribacteria bacterium]|nr:hypothetical protein [Candidatus Poribacteria bacterium]
MREPFDDATKAFYRSLRPGRLDGLSPTGDGRGLGNRSSSNLAEDFGGRHVNRNGPGT